MFRLGVLEPSESAFSSPLVIVRKFDEIKSVCIYFRQINNALKAKAEAISNAEKLFAIVSSKRYFSKLDLTKGYWQVPLVDFSKPVTAF